LLGRAFVDLAALAALPPVRHPVVLLLEGRRGRIFPLPFDEKSDQMRDETTLQSHPSGLLSTQNIGQDRLSRGEVRGQEDPMVLRRDFAIFVGIGRVNAVEPAHALDGFEDDARRGDRARVAR
jgi:hypothetical protein